MTTFLVVDIGRTNFRMRGCRLDKETGKVQQVTTDIGISGDLNQLRSTLIQGVSRLSDVVRIEEVTVAVIGVPGKVSEDRRSAALTYIDPSGYTDIADWLEYVGVQKVKLYNDLELGSLGIQATPLAQFSMLSGTKLTQIPDSYMVGMPGTGLGVGFCRHGIPQATEGGHGQVVYNPDDPVESHIWRELYRMDQSAFPVYDDLACGRGLATLARILSTPPDAVSYQKLDVSSLSDAELPEKLSEWAAASQKHVSQHNFALEVFHHFGTFLGRALQLPVLTTLPQALFLAGPIISANLEHFQNQFLQAFHSHRHHGEWLNSLPIAVVKHPELNIDGAIEIAKREI